MLANIFLRAYSDTAPAKPKFPSSQDKHDATNEVCNVSSEEQEKKTVEMTPEIKNILLKKFPPPPCYRDLQSNNPHYSFALPGLSFPKDVSLFANHQAIAKYFEEYAKKYELLPLIKFNTSVDFVSKNKQNNTWELSLSKYDVNESGSVTITRWKETFDAVVSASGIHQNANIPDFKDLAAWDAMWPERAIHSNQYRRPEDFKDKVKTNKQ